MLQRFAIIFALLVAIVPAYSQETDDFAQQVDLTPLRTLTIQHAQTLKTLDTYARQTLNQITGKSTLDGHDALYSVLDITFQPQAYLHRNLIRIKNATLRHDFQELDIIDAEEKARILKEGTISLHFFLQPQVQEMLSRVQSSAVHKFDAVNELRMAAMTMQELLSIDMRDWPMIAPPTADPSDHLWRRMNQVAGAIPEFRASAAAVGLANVPEVPEYAHRADLLKQVLQSMVDLRVGWMRRNAQQVNDNAVRVAEVLPQINPEVYPSFARRKTEVLYNRLFKLTLPGAALYFVAFVCFLMAARSRVTGLRLWGLRLLVVGFVVHTLGIAVRWWLVEKSVGNWFESIPIKNQFESVLFSAWFGALLGLILELRKGRSIFGAAASFVGWLSLTAIFAAPYVFKREIGGEIGQLSGVLMSYWLYLHVTTVTASYALIAMSFLLGVWWLVVYFREHRTVSRLPARQLSADAAERDESAYLPGGSGRAGALSLSAWQMLAMALFIPQPKVREKLAAVRTARAAQPAQERARTQLATLDLCNLVVLQLAFWVLGVGIILGAVWADQSWGRPWGWDPKETFALVTWIVYLVIVHVRFITPEKAWWTSVLSIVGFFIMLFNWIGVNFFLVGLHSYA